MREIKFRAWHSIKNEWLHNTDDACNILGECVLLGAWCKVPLVELKDVVVEQYIGIKDKTGKEIYEGDIVRIHYRRDTGSISGHVHYHPIYPMFGISTGYKFREFGKRWTTYEVIGNIHENSELEDGK